MRVTDGSVSARFQRLRLPLGAGLGGLVAQTGTPYVTADYADDERFRHTGEIDAGVREEGLVAILGVPLRLGPTSIGVLYRRQPLGPPVRPRGGGAAGLAGRARGGGDRHRPAADRDAYRAGRAVRRQRDDPRAQQLGRARRGRPRPDDRAGARGGGVEDVAPAVTDVLGGALLALDADGRELARVGQVDEPEPSVVDRRRSRPRAPTGAAVRRGRSWYAAVVAGTEGLGALVFRPDGRPGRRRPAHPRAGGHW